MCGVRGGATIRAMSGQESKSLSQCCKECHFLARNTHINESGRTLGPDPEGVFEKEVSTEIRAELATTDCPYRIEGLRVNEGMHCYHRLT